METQKLGPGDLAKSVDNDFFLPRKELAQLQLYAYQASALPIGAEDLYVSLFGKQPDTQLEADEERFPIEKLRGLGDVFGNMAQHTELWNKDIHPAIVDTAHRVSQYAVKSNQIYKSLIHCIQELQHDPRDTSMRKRIHRIADRLGADIGSNIATMRTTLEKLRAFVKSAEQNRQSLEAERRTLQALIDSEDAQLEAINADLAEAEEQLNAANKRYLEEATLAATSPAYRLVGYALAPFTLCMSIPVSDVAIVVVSAVCTTEALKAKADMDAAVEKIKELTSEKLSVLNLRAGLRLALRSGNEMATCAAAIEPSLDQAIKAWDQLAEDIDRLKSAVDDDPDSVPMLFRRRELKAALAAWRKIGRAADEFRVYAYVRILPEEGEEDGSTSTTPVDNQTTKEASHV